MKHEVRESEVIKVVKASFIAPCEKTIRYQAMGKDMIEVKEGMEEILKYDNRSELNSRNTVENLLMR